MRRKEKQWFVDHLQARCRGRVTIELVDAECNRIKRDII